MAEIIDGKKISTQIKEEIAQQVKEHVAQGGPALTWWDCWWATMVAAKATWHRRPRHASNAALTRRSYAWKRQ